MVARDCATTRETSASSGSESKLKSVSGDARVNLDLWRRSGGGVACLSSPDEVHRLDKGLLLDPQASSATSGA